MSNFSDYKDVKLTPGFAYVEVFGAYNQTPDGKPLMTKTGFPMLSVTLSVVDRDANVGRRKLYIPSNMPSKIINVENAFGIQDLFDAKRNEFNYDLILRKSAGAVLVADATYGINFEMFVPIAFYHHISKADNTNYNLERPKALNDAYSGVRAESAKRLTKDVDLSNSDSFDDIPF